MLRLLFALLIVALETTAISLPLTALVAGAPPWPLLFVCVALGWLAAEIGLRLPARFERPALLAGAALAAVVLIAVSLGRAPLAVVGTLLPGSPDLLAAYGLLLLALVLAWRGTRVNPDDSAAVAALFGRAVAIGLGGLLLGAVSRSGLPLGSPAVLSQVVALVGLGLLALALAHAQDVGDLGSLNWRWLLTLLAAVGLVLLLATLGVALLGGTEVAGAAQELLRLALLPLALVGGLLVWVLLTLFAEPLRQLIAAIVARMQGIELPPTDIAVGERQGAEAVGEAITRLANGATFLLALIPLVILLAAILLMRRRARTRTEGTEERESLDVGAALLGDLRGLLGGLQNPFARRLTGLRAALAALTGSDPASRVRRAYIGLLLFAEHRERPRPPALTPAEFAPEAIAVAPEPVVARLTAAYERARYDPAGPSPDEAAAAEAALRTIERAE